MIERIYIENYKSIKKLDINLNMINILIGANGAGKSNFISFFRFLNSITNKKMQTHILEEAGSEYILHHGLKNSEYIKARVELTEEDISNYYSFSLLPNTEGSLFFETENLGYKDKSKYDRFYHYENNFAKGLESGITEFRVETEKVQKMVASRLGEYKIYHFHDTGKTARIKQSFNLYDNEFLYTDARNLASFLYKLQETNSIVLSKIEKTVRLIAPYFDKFYLKPNPFNQEEIRLGWKEKNSEMIFNANHLSDGTLRMICLITLFLQPDPPKTIILDEPELGLHPFALKVLADLIKKVAKKNIQVIISTQSVTLVNNFELEDIIVVDKENTESTFKRMDISEFTEWLEDTKKVYKSLI